MYNSISFRDPSGTLIISGDKVIRIVYESGSSDLKLFHHSTKAQKLMETGKVILTKVHDREECNKLCLIDDIQNIIDYNRISYVLRHEYISFPSFPYEWSPRMLYEAATLTLYIAEYMLQDQICIKDATPYNILFKGPVPVFVDILSFEGRDANDPMWIPHAQFIRTFYLPLLVNAHFGICLDQIFQTRHDGIESEEAYLMCGMFKRVMSPFLFDVSLPLWLSYISKNDTRFLYRNRNLRDPFQAQFILKTLFNSLKKKLQKIKPAISQNSHWSTYMNSHSYSCEHFKIKREFIESVLRDTSLEFVLDIGCNTGFFSEIAARAGKRVVAIDRDPAVINQVWTLAIEDHLDILPLVVNISRPSPPIGWLNQEFPSFLERAEGRFDMVLMLAVLHHILVTDQIPLDMIIDLAARLTKNMLIIEFVSPKDEMFVRLSRGREYLYEGLTLETFESSCRRYFYIEGYVHIEGTYRWIYSLRKRELYK